MRCIGSALFAEADLWSMLLHSANAAAREAVFALVLETPEPTKRRVREVVRAATQIEPVVRGEPRPAVLSSCGGGGRELLELTCSVPFSGAGELLRCSAPIWPPPRAVRGSIQPGVLVLTAEGWTGDEQWLSTVIGSELKEIDRILMAQAVSLRRYRPELDARMNALAERVHPRINRSHLVSTYSFSLLGNIHPQVRELVGRRVAAETYLLWKRWSK